MLYVQDPDSAIVSTGYSFAGSIAPKGVHGRPKLLCPVHPYHVMLSWRISPDYHRGHLNIPGGVLFFPLRRLSGCCFWVFQKNIFMFLGVLPLYVVMGNLGCKRLVVGSYLWGQKIFAGLGSPTSQVIKEFPAFGYWEFCFELWGVNSNDYRSGRP